MYAYSSKVGGILTLKVKHKNPPLLCLMIYVCLVSCLVSCVGFVIWIEFVLYNG